MLIKFEIMRHINSTLVVICCFLTACSNTAPVDEQIVVDSPTNPKVSQRAVISKKAQIKPGDPKFSPVRSSLIKNIQLPSGSLFNPQQAIGLYQPSNNYQVGDMILVQVNEKTSANKSIKFKSNKQGHFELEPVAFNAGSIKVGGDDLSAEYKQSKDFDSSAQANQKNALKGDITVYVTEVLNNGNLIIAGEKWITLNTGEEYIRFSGEVRVSDISLDHTVHSVRVGNAHIQYSGIGEMQDNQDPSLIGKLFSIFD